MSGHDAERRHPCRRRTAAAASLMLTLLAAGCGDSTTSPTAQPANPSAPSASSTPDTPGVIEQPVVPSDLPVAPDSARVDLQLPTFSNPTEITNPLFPISQQASVLLLGEVEAQAFRTEVTLLPDTRTMRWEGQAIEVAVSQYVAFLDGRIEEVAYDLYAQADDGSVWYFGEDVFNFADGAVVDTHGTWFAGIDGPAAMIMPADPQVGDVYRPENIPGLVFEEVTVTAIDQTVDGPFGPIDGALVVSELHMDGASEEKTFAPGYGEFYTAAGGDVEALAMAVPTDALDDALPDELATLATGAEEVFDAARAEDWAAVDAALADVTSAWEAYASGEVPALVEPLMTDAVDALTAAVETRDAEAAGAAIDVGRLALDLQLRYRPVAEVDIARLGLWAQQLLVDAAADDFEAVSGDQFSLDMVRDRIASALDGDALTQLNTAMEELNGAVGDGDPDAIAEVADGLRELVAEVLAA